MGSAVSIAGGRGRLAELEQELGDAAVGAEEIEQRPRARELFGDRRSADGECQHSQHVDLGGQHRVLVADIGGHPVDKAQGKLRLRLSDGESRQRERVVRVVDRAGARPGELVSARAAYAQAAERVMDALRDLDRAPPAQRDFGDAAPVGAATSNFTHDGYKQAVEKAKDYIRAGDIFQVVPSQRWVQDFTLPPFAFYRSLRRTNPSPFMFFFNFGPFQVVGASPEILVRLRDGEVTVRPIAGTRMRGATPEEDKALELDLLADKKELAEHLMLLDLGRNDVGRVAKVGSVHPTEKFIVERYSHVMHIVSNVVGQIADGEDALSALLAGMPAGTVSGAPKVRAMEIIDELEPEKRGIYGGGVGYFACNGEMDFCIALRTAVLKDDKLYIQAGGGVVYDSDPEAEYQETVNKSKALRRAAEDAGTFTRRGNF